MDYALGLFSGLVIFNYFAECLARAPSLVLANPNYVKKVVFPVEIIPMAVNISALFHLVVNGVLLLVVLMSTHGGLPVGALWLLAVLVPLILFAQGVLWVFAALGVFIRDVVLLIPPFTQMLMFGSAVFYTISSLPRPFAGIIAWNPLAQICEMARGALIAGQRPNLAILGAVTLASLVVCLLGYEFFRRCRPAFADVL
jgi:lipopolysaccharide transport system permease protein